MIKFASQIIAMKLADAIEAKRPDLADAARRVSCFSHHFEDADMLVAMFWRAWKNDDLDRFLTAVVEHADNLVDKKPLPKLRGWSKAEFNEAREFARKGLEREILRTCGHSKRAWLKRLIGYLDRAEV